MYIRFWIVVKVTLADSMTQSGECYHGGERGGEQASVTLSVHVHNFALEYSEQIALLVNVCCIFVNICICAGMLRKQMKKKINVCLI